MHSIRNHERHKLMSTNLLTLFLPFDKCIEQAATNIRKRKERRKLWIMFCPPLSMCFGSIFFIYLPSGRNKLQWMVGICVCVFIHSWNVPVWTLKCFALPNHLGALTFCSLRTSFLPHRCWCTVLEVFSVFPSLLAVRCRPYPPRICAGSSMALPLLVWLQLHCCDTAPETS